MKTIEEFGAKEIDLTRKRQSKAAELAAAERAAGESYLVGEGSVAVEAVLRLQAEIAAIGRAITTVRFQRSELIRASFQREAAASRATASRKRGELDLLIRKREQLLAKFAELEGTAGNFTPPPIREPGAQMRSETLIQEIGAAGSRAATLESCDVPEVGVFDNEDSAACDDSAVVAAILQQASDGPTAADVFAWLEAVETEVGIRNQTGEKFDQLPRRVRIEWRRGKIDTGKSYVFCPQLAPRTFSTIGTGEAVGFDVGAGTFRAGGKLA